MIYDIINSITNIQNVIIHPLREDKLDVLERRCVESGLKTSDIWWYADLRRYGSVPHAGIVVAPQTTNSPATT